MSQKFPNKFRGHHSHLIDKKGRLSVPAQFREVLANVYKEERLMLTAWGNCLVAYPFSEWLKIEERVNNLPQMKPEVMAFQLAFISRAVECEFDQQGRILIPPTLRKQADLKREVIIVGMLTRFQIWNKQRLEEQIKRFTENFEKISNALGDLGL